MSVVSVAAVTGLFQIARTILESLRTLAVDVDIVHLVPDDETCVVVSVAASTAFITPVGYQTNLMVYGPGGYRFSDFFRVGTPLQLLLAVVTTLSIGWLYGV